MDKETKDETQKEELPAADAGEGSEPETTQLIDDANLAAKRMEDANKEKKDLLDREESLAAKKVLGGRSEGGIVKKEETEDEKWAKDAKIRYAGTGLDPTDEEDGAK